ncbi:MAG: hypothetical protein IKI64_02465 [Clostridia bacterium]|nr:hypothetical protein [Clostridia bacterium]
MKRRIKDGFMTRVKLGVCALLIAAVPLSATLAASSPAENAESAATEEPGAGAYYRMGIFSCARLTPTEYVEKTTGAKVSDAKLVFHEDDHGGFHGDGDTLMVFDCSEAGGDFESSLSEWRELPMSDKLYYALFDQRADMGEPLGRLFARFDIDYDHDTPAVKDGLYYFENRLSTAKSRDDEVLCNGSWNFTFAVYDRETKKLYYMEVDT